MLNFGASKPRVRGGPGPPGPPPGSAPVDCLSVHEFPNNFRVCVFSTFCCDSSRKILPGINMSENRNYYTSADWMKESKWNVSNLSLRYVNILFLGERCVNVLLPSERCVNVLILDERCVNVLLPGERCVNVLILGERCVNVLLAGSAQGPDSGPALCRCHDSG